MLKREQTVGGYIDEAVSSESYPKVPATAIVLITNPQNKRRLTMINNLTIELTVVCSFRFHLGWGGGGGERFPATRRVDKKG